MGQGVSLGATDAILVKLSDEANLSTTSLPDCDAVPGKYGICLGGNFRWRAATSQVQPRMLEANSLKKSIAIMAI